MKRLRALYLFVLLSAPTVSSMAHASNACMLNLVRLVDPSRYHILIDDELAAIPIPKITPDFRLGAGSWFEVRERVEDINAVLAQAFGGRRMTGLRVTEHLTHGGFRMVFQTSDPDLVVKVYFRSRHAEGMLNREIASESVFKEFGIDHAELFPGFTDHERTNLLNQGIVVQRRIHGMTLDRVVPGGVLNPNDPEQKPATDHLAQVQSVSNQILEMQQYYGLPVVNAGAFGDQTPIGVDYTSWENSVFDPQSGRYVLVDW